jgi:hypothetical protein
MQAVPRCLSDSEATHLTIRHGPLALAAARRVAQAWPIRKIVRAVQAGRRTARQPTCNRRP